MITCWYHVHTAQTGYQLRTWHEVIIMVLFLCFVLPYLTLSLSLSLFLQYLSGVLLFFCCACSFVRSPQALTPNLLARTIETIEGGGLVILLLKTVTSLKQLYAMSMDVHSRYVAARWFRCFVFLMVFFSRDGCAVVLFGGVLR